MGAVSHLGSYALNIGAMPHLITMIKGHLLSEQSFQTGRLVICLYSYILLIRNVVGCS